MNREIKFRLWDGKKTIYQNERHMFNGVFMQKRPVPQIITVGSAITNGIQVMQYTGLKDKNGREIYEGDVLRLNGGAKDVFGAIGFEDGCFVLEAPWTLPINSFPELKAYTDMVFCEVEVAGNIYENPQLTHP